MRHVFGIALLGVILLPVTAAAAFLAALLVFTDAVPLVPDRPPPAPEDVVAVRELVRDLRAAAAPGSTARLRTDTGRLDSALLLGGRFVPGLRGRIDTDGGAVTVALSVPVPRWPGERWLNLTARIPPFTGEVAPERVTLGGREIPPALAMGVLRHGADLVLGDGLGETILGAATGLRIDGRTLDIALAVDEMGKNGVMRGTFGALRGQAMPARAEVDRYHAMILAAMAEGRLPRSGSFLPYLDFTLRAVLAETAPADPAQRYTAAILALARVCGARDFAAVVGRLVFGEAEVPPPPGPGCADLTLNGRIDSRRHFVTSAALQAASNRGFAVSIGEFKELHDTISGAGGFDFTDLAANLSGIALSDRLMSAPEADWPGLVARIDSERDVIVAFDTVPGLMPAAAFRARYGDVESAAYAAELARIAASIDALALYRGAGSGP